MKGFTLTELLLSIGLLLFITALAAPIGMNFYKNRVSSELELKVITALRRAQNQALFQEKDSSFGVKFLTSSYVLFAGSSYSEGSVVQEFDLPDNAEITGSDEVVFTKRTATTSPASLEIERFGRTQQILINKEGLVELE